MKNHFVTYNQSLALKELGFDEYCFKYQLEGYSPNVKTCRVPGYLELIKNSELNETSVAIPLKSQVFEFFRDNHNYVYQINYLYNGNYQLIIHKNTHEYMELIEKHPNSCVDEVPDNYSYEEAESACIDKLIEIIKNK